MGKDGGGGGGSPGYYHDYTQWTAAERDYVTNNPDLQAAYDAGYITYSPSQLAEKSEMILGVDPINVGGLASQIMGFTKYDYEALQKTGLTAETWANYEASYTKEQGAIQAGIEATHQQMLAEQQALIEAGIPAYTLDPTPWDETTEADRTEMQKLQVEYAAEQARLEEEARLAEEEAAAEAAIQADLGTMTELAALRNQSETLATADVDEYIAEKTQQMKLRGITSPFTGEVREDLINTRFAEYWSTQNEQRLQELISQYSTEYGYPEISERVLGAAAESLLPTTTTQATTTQVSDTDLVGALIGEASEATLLTQSFLEEDIELLGSPTLLGG